MAQESGTLYQTCQKGIGKIAELSANFNNAEKKSAIMQPLGEMRRQLSELRKSGASPEARNESYSQAIRTMQALRDGIAAINNPTKKPMLEQEFQALDENILRYYQTAFNEAPDQQPAPDAEAAGRGPEPAAAAAPKPGQGKRAAAQEPVRREETQEKKAAPAAGLYSGWAQRQGEGPIVVEDGQRVFTRRQLARLYNGAGTNPAYIAVDGVVYDVSGLPAWSGGMNEGRLPGKDYTEEIRQEGEETLRELRRLAPVVGKLADKEA